MSQVRNSMPVFHLEIHLATPAAFSENGQKLITVYQLKSDLHKVKVTGISISPSRQIKGESLPTCLVLFFFFCLFPLSLPGPLEHIFQTRGWICGQSAIYRDDAWKTLPLI